MPERLAPFLAPLAAVKPILYVAGLIAATVFGYTKFVARVERIEDDVRVIKMLVCRQYPTDTSCGATQ